MKTPVLNRSVREQRMIDYLLGAVSDEDATRLEDEFFVNEAVHQQLLALETELVDGYARGELIAAERERFERRLRDSPEYRRRVALARELIGSASASRTTSRRHRIVYAALAAVLVVATSTLVLRLYPDRQVVAPSRHDPTKAVLPSPPAPVSPELVLRLRPGSTRSPGATQALVVPPTSSLRLQLEYEGPSFAAYHVVITTAEGRGILDRPVTTDADGAIVVDVARAVLVPADYVVILSGVTPPAQREVADYTFRVLRQ